MNIMINDVIYYLLQNIDNINNKNFLFDNYKKKKYINITEIEEIIYKNNNINMIMDLLRFWVKYIPFNKDYIYFIMVYYIFINRIEYIKKLLIIRNIPEIFYYINGIYYRSIYGYYNEEDDLENYELKNIKISFKGIVKYEDLLTELNIKYDILYQIVKKFEKIKDIKEDINEIQKKNKIFNKSVNINLGYE